MNKRVPREDSLSIQMILTDPKLNDHEKAQEIHRYDYDMACRETDGRLPKLMTVEEIEIILEGRK